MATTTYYVYSTLACPQDYAAHQAGTGDLPAEIPPVRINGGAGVTNKALITPRGVVTTITAEEHARLVEDPVFRLHRDNGFVSVEPRAHDPERVASTMSAADPSRPLEPGDLELDPDSPKADSGPGKAARKK